MLRGDIVSRGVLKPIIDVCRAVLLPSVTGLWPLAKCPAMHLTAAYAPGPLDGPTGSVEGTALARHGRDAVLTMSRLPREPVGHRPATERSHRSLSGRSAP